MGDFVHRGPEGSFVDRRRLVESADLPNELERGRADLILGDGRIEVEERSDVAAHAGPKVAEPAARLRLSRKILSDWAPLRLIEQAAIDEKRQLLPAARRAIPFLCDPALFLHHHIEKVLRHRSGIAKLGPAFCDDRFGVVQLGGKQRPKLSRTVSKTLRGGDQSSEELHQRLALGWV